MATTVPTSFVQQYEQEVKQAYQREGALLRGTVRSRSQVGAERIYFPKLGKGSATDKARHADVTPMDLEHSRVFADMVDRYAPEYIDDLDQAKTNWSLASEYARSSAYALGRETDNIIVDALNTTPAGQQFTAVDLDSASSGELTLKAIAELSKVHNQADVPMDNMRYAVISPETHSELLQLTEATSTDFTTTQLLMNAREPAMWMGYRWIMHTGLPDGVKGFFYHQSSVGFGISRDINTQVDWIAQKVAFLVNSWMSMGATIIEDEGVIRLDAV